VRLRVIAAAVTLFAAGLLASCGASSGSEGDGSSTSGLATAACEQRLETISCHSMEEFPP
jgi:hypothetical protein